MSRVNTHHPPVSRDASRSTLQINQQEIKGDTVILQVVLFFFYPVCVWWGAVGGIKLCKEVEVMYIMCTYKGRMYASICCFIVPRSNPI